MFDKARDIFYKFRDFWWNYPNYLSVKGGAFSTYISLYKSLRPFSHIFVFVLLFLIIGVADYFYAIDNLFVQKKTLIEGVVTGKAGLSRINPLIPTNNQLEVDLSKLIYHGLVNVDSSGKVHGVLADRWEAVGDTGKEFVFYLREDILWHDERQFSADDVIATFDILKSIANEKDSGMASKYTEASENMKIEKVDQNTVRFRLKDVNPTFFEDISFGILPKHILDQVSLSTFSWADFNLNPIGTGPYIFSSYKKNVLTLQANPNYFDGVAKVDRIKMNLYETGDEAVDALKSGTIHMLADPSSKIIENLKSWNNIKTILSTPLYRRYWALYFNLKQGGPDIFNDQTVRQAISSAIRREEIIDAIDTAGEEAMGPIPKNSWAYNEDAKRYRYNLKRANRMLTSAGWKRKAIDEKIVREKEGKFLRFKLSYLDKYDREVTARSIQEDLEKIGVVVELDPRSTSDLNEALIATRNFETVLYGVETPIDPDRIRLWHSKAIEYPGLNISSYKSEESGAVIGDSQNIERINLVDAALENAISTIDREKRNGEGGISIGYYKFQEILMEECPAVFLYHPVFVTVIHSRVKGVDLSDMTSPEDRYLNVTDWYIE